MEQLLFYLSPIFITILIAEWYYVRSQGDTTMYSTWDSVANFVTSWMHQFTDTIAWLLVLPLYFWLYEHRFFEISLSWWSVLLLFVLQDFLYYWFHRFAHNIRWMWASHVTHHSSEHLNLSTAFRQSATYPISGMWVFWLPLALLGFDPKAVVTIVMVNLAYQFYIHTQVIKKMGRWEWLLNTPSHHRVHHARNPEYIDKNFGGVFIIWDRMFGTFVEERDDLPCEFGITKQIYSNNPLVLTFHEWIDMFKEVAKPGPWSLRLKHLWAAPDWERPETGVETAAVDNGAVAPAVNHGVKSEPGSGV